MPINEAGGGLGDTKTVGFISVVKSVPNAVRLRCLPLAEMGAMPATVRFSVVTSGRKVAPKAVTRRCLPLAERGLLPAAMRRGVKKSRTLPPCWEDGCAGGAVFQSLQQSLPTGIKMSSERSALSATRTAPSIALPTQPSPRMAHARALTWVKRNTNMRSAALSAPPLRSARKCFRAGTKRPISSALTSSSHTEAAIAPRPPLLSVVSICNKMDGMRRKPTQSRANAMAVLERESAALSRSSPAAASNSTTRFLPQSPTHPVRNPKKETKSRMTKPEKPITALWLSLENSTSLSLIRLPVSNFACATANAAMLGCAARGSSTSSTATTSRCPASTRRPALQRWQSSTQATATAKKMTPIVTQYCWSKLKRTTHSEEARLRPTEVLTYPRTPENAVGKGMRERRCSSASRTS